MTIPGSQLLEGANRTWSARMWTTDVSVPGVIVAQNVVPATNTGGSLRVLVLMNDATEIVKLHRLDVVVTVV